MTHSAGLLSAPELWRAGLFAPCAAGLADYLLHFLPCPPYKASVRPLAADLCMPPSTARNDEHPYWLGGVPSRNEVLT